jgi:hypothetical protein
MIPPKTDVPVFVIVQIVLAQYFRQVRSRRMKGLLGTIQRTFSDVIEVDFGGFSPAAYSDNKRRLDDYQKANVSPHFHQ